MLSPSLTHLASDLGQPAGHLSAPDGWLVRSTLMGGARRGACAWGTLVSVRCCCVMVSDPTVVSAGNTAN